MRRAIQTAAIAGIAAGTVGVLASALDRMLEIEESLGLGLLYSLRGEVTPEANVVIVAIDSESADELGLSAALHEEYALTGWPRSLHSDTIRALDAAGARLIALDILFEEPRQPADDMALADAIGAAGSVILFEGLDRSVELSSDEASGTAYQIVQTRRLQPLPLFRDAAIAAVPFQLPKFPVRTNQYWPFVPDLYDVPTLPVAAFVALHERAHARLIELIGADRIGPGDALARLGFEETIARLRTEFLRDAGLGDVIGKHLGQLAATEPGLADTIGRLVAIYTGPESRYLNYYGPPRTFTTIPVHEILRQGPDPDIDWENTVVLIGYSNETQPQQADNFLSFYSQRSALDVSGVEIAATALANLLEQRTLAQIPLARHLAIVLLAGLAFGACFAAPRIVVALAGFAILVGGYLLIARLQFDLANSWWPVVVPLLIQAPLALVLGLTLHYSRARRQHAAVTRGASRYLPAELVTRIADNPDATTHASELIDGVCLVTDIENYTAYSESLAPKRLEAALNAYYDSLFTIVDANGGLMTDIVGDSMVAVWRPAGPNTDVATPALRAALEIRDRLSRRVGTFSRTRVGLNSGEFLLGTVGAREHLEYRAVGDVVNSAARIQTLNKRLGTTVLTTRNLLSAGGIVYRALGSFQLTGKTAILDICEPLAHETGSTSAQRDLILRFGAACEHFHRGRLEEALRAFRALQSDFETDGPTRFYVEYIRHRLNGPLRDDHDPIIRLSG